MFIGLLLVLLGIFMLLEHMGIIYGRFIDYFVPIAIIALGGSFIFKDRKDKQ